MSCWLSNASHLIWCPGEHVLQPGTLMYPVADASSPGKWAIWWVITLGSGGVDWWMVLVFSLTHTGNEKGEMYVLRLLKQREHLRDPAFSVVVSMEERGKWPRGAEWNMRVKQSHSQIPSSLPNSLVGLFLCHRRVRRLFAKAGVRFFPYEAVRLWIFKVLLESGRKAWHQKPKTTFPSRSWAVTIWGTNGLNKQ